MSSARRIATCLDIHYSKITEGEKEEEEKRPLEVVKWR